MKTICKFLCLLTLTVFLVGCERHEPVRQFKASPDGTLTIPGHNNTIQVR